MFNYLFLKFRDFVNGTKFGRLRVVLFLGPRGMR